MSVNKSFTKIPKKFQPKGMEIIYEDRDIIVIDKSAGLLTIGTDRERDKTAYALLTNYVKKGNPKSPNRIFIVHRLDRDTSGLLVFAKTPKAKNFLQENWAKFSKTYYAVANGLFEQKEGVIKSYLKENKAFRVYSTKDKGSGKLSETQYKVIKENINFSLLEITLLTGRKNQIRVHLSDINNPIVGDKVYGNQNKGANRLALHSAKMICIHPYTKKEISFDIGYPAGFKYFFKVK